MYARLGYVVARYWYAVLAIWLVIAVGAFQLVPLWDEVKHDGDLAYMPVAMPSVRAEKLLAAAFPGRRSKSKIVIVASRDERQLSQDDELAIDRVAAQLQNLAGVSAYQQQADSRAESDPVRAESGDAESTDDVPIWQQRATDAWDEALRLDPEIAFAYNNLAVLAEAIGDTATRDLNRQLAGDYWVESQTPIGVELLPRLESFSRILDVWTRHTQVVGSKLRSRDGRAELIVVRLTDEFMATTNIALLRRIEQVIASVQSRADFPPGLQIDITGSAAVGGDMLRSAEESIRSTEFYSLMLVLGILIYVYRAPLLVAVPLTSIVVSVVVATAVVAVLTQLHQLPGFGWWDFKIFTTTRIFVIVILFGAGTDFCLFLIARYREELQAGRDIEQAVERAVAGVGEALTASALTTIVGFSMMFWADFGKFRNSGPALGLCLLVTLVACLTLAPALLRCLGWAVFFPQRRPTITAGSDRGTLWDRLANRIIRYPAVVFAASMVVLAPLAVLGGSVEVTYDFLRELSPTRPSRRGAERVGQFFPIGETSPIVVLAKVGADTLDSDDGKAAVADLTRALYVDGVRSVRSWAEPTGNQPSGFSLKKAALQSHQLTRSLYLGTSERLNGDVARLEVFVDHDPFSLAAIHVLNRIDNRLQQEARDSSTFWGNAEFAYAGTTAGIRDLRTVTSADNRRIRLLVVLAVFAVLLLMLQRPLVCFYLILSVLLSYFVTMGIAELFFRWSYGDTFRGLDWKVPLFVFVILVAIGQDYNIYLATRVFEEQATHGLFGGLRRAVVRTGGIITSCGVIMAGTFVSMVSGSLRGMVELGFALSVGVLLDTFVVRPILVPAFLALLFRVYGWSFQDNRGSKSCRSTINSRTV